MAAKKQAVSEPQKSGGKAPSIPPVVAEVLTEGTFSVEKFVENFEVLVEASGGTGQLRQMVANLAVHGNLVGTTGSADTATALVQSVIRKAVLQDLPSSDVPFQAPPGWTWCFLGNLCVDVHYGFTASARPELRKTRLLRITDIQNDRVEWDSVPGCEIEDDKIAQYVLRDGDLLIARTGGTIGKTYLVYNPTVQAVFASYLIRALPVLSSVSPYLKLYAGTSLYWRQLYAGAAGTGQPNVNATTLKALLIPLPPLAEQKRIVARVDQLMALIDELEAKQNRKRELSAKFSKASLEALTNAQNPAEFDVAWKRVVENWETVVDRAERVGDVRRSILALAASGRLCRSKPSDGDTSRELTDLLAVRMKQVAKEPVEAALDTRPDIPAGWHWTSLDSLLVVLRNGVSTRPSGSTGVPVLRISAVRPNSVNTYETRFLPGTHDDYAGFFVQPGDLLFTRYSGNAEFVGACGVVPEGTRDLVHPDKLIRGVVVPGLVDPHYVAIAMSTGRSRTHVDKCGQTTAGQIGISGKQLKSTPIPLPPLAEQKRIVAKVNELTGLCSELESKLRRLGEVQELFATSAVASLTGSQPEKKEPMKAPKTELVARLTLGKKPLVAGKAPLATLLAQNDGELNPKALWRYSGFEKIDDFYHQLKLEIQEGWIVQPETPSVRVVGDR